MKRHHIVLSSFAAASMALSACQQYSKNPVENLATMREAGKNELVLGPDKPQIIVKEVPVEVPHEVIKYVTIYEPKVVTKIQEQATIDEKYLIIAPDLDMTFVEGKTSSYKIRVRVLVPGAVMKLVGKNMPDGATLKDVSTANEPGLFELSWTPALGTVLANSARKVETMKVVAEIVETKTDADKKVLEGILREKEIQLSVFRDQTPPSDLKIVDLGNEVAEGTLVPFKIIVKVPGVDGKTMQKPTLITLFDGVSSSPGQDFIERDGTRHVIPDLKAKDVEYLGNQVWQFNRVFDTKNIGAQPQLNKDGSVIANADGVNTRLSFKVYSPNGAATAQVLTQVKIKYSLNIQAPRFDLKGIGADVLELTPGQTIKLNFYVESADTRAAVQVQKPDLKSLKGTPSLDCYDSSAGTFRQACVLSWSVPCDATDADLKQSLQLSATATWNKIASQTSKQVLKTQRSKLASFCQTTEVKK